MDFVGLHGVGDELASSLPYGGQRRVEIARALASEPAAAAAGRAHRRDEPARDQRGDRACSGASATNWASPSC